MINLVVMPLGVAALVVVGWEGALIAFWVGAVAFWFYCLSTQLVERMGQSAPDELVMLGLACMVITLVAGVYGAVTLIL